MTDQLPLGAEFPPASREDWLKLVRAALKERPFERLTAKSYDGIAIEPLYPPAAESRTIVARRGPWHVMARVDHPDPAAANSEALHELENGATGLWLVFAGANGAYGYGLPPEPEAVERVLEGVHLDAVAIEIDIAETSKQAADHVAALVRRRGLAPGSVNIRFGHDPIGAHAPSGESPLAWGDLAPRFAGHVAELAKQGFGGPLTVADGRVIHNSGGSEAQELAFVLAVAVAYLRALEAAGVPLDEARSLIGFRLSADADEFLTIAKHRALRKLWAHAEQACDLVPKATSIATETAWRMMTRRDPWVNMLRTTIAAFSAGLGGADAMAVLPFTAALGLPDRFARRNARNTQLILLEEANLARVADPAAGAGGIEALTTKLGQAAWALFQEIERAGGAPSALEKGLIQAQVARVRMAREAAVAQRRDALTGTSDFPNLAETPVEVLDVEPAKLGSYPAAVRYPPLPPMRLAEPFERLRDLSDRMMSATGRRPKVFLANLGALPEFTARSTFAKNFFEAGGIEAITSDGFAGREQMVDAFKASGAKLACLCSSDKVYDSEAATAATALRDAGAHVLLAGRPQQADALRTAGVADCIYAGCDAVAALAAAHSVIATGR